MSKLKQILDGQIVLEEKNSPINGDLTVIRDLVFGTYILGGGLPQSGGLAAHIWKISLKEVLIEKSGVKSALIVGLGGGGIARIIRKNWPDAQIVGVDIDPVMVELGQKYLGLTKAQVKTHIDDAEHFIVSEIKAGKKYDLVCFDTYVGENFPKKFESVTFITKVSKLLNNDGLAVFNRLYGSEDRNAAHQFADSLRKVFKSVEPVYPVANVMYLCSQT